MLLFGSDQIRSCAGSLGLLLPLPPAGVLLSESDPHEVKQEREIDDRTKQDLFCRLQVDFEDLWADYEAASGMCLLLYGCGNTNVPIDFLARVLSFLALKMRDCHPMATGKRSLRAKD